MKTDLQQLLSLLATSKDTTNNLTGSWRYFKPVFAERHAPCEAACPAGNPVKKFLALAAEGKTSEALAAIKAENPLPSVCGRVCHHPCATECTRGRLDEELAPNLVERALGDATPDIGLQLPEPASRTGKKVAVIGAGPAGLSCAYHCALLGHDVTIYDEAEHPGGMLRLGIPAYRLPRADLDRDLGFIKELGIAFHGNTSFNNFSALKPYDAVAVCTGAHSSRALGIDGENSNGVIAGLEFLREVNAGGSPTIGKNALIIGGGNTAMDCARAALRLGAKATIAYRRGREDMPALPDEISEADEEGAQFVTHAAPIRVVADAKGKVSSVEFIRTAPGEPGPDGRRTFKTLPGSEFTLKASSLIIAAGEMPAVDFLPEGMLVNGAPAASEATCFTGNAEGGPAIFAAGDATPGSTRTVSHAIGAGKRAAMAMHLHMLEDSAAAGEKISSAGIEGGASVSMEAFKAGRWGGPAPAAKRTDANIVLVTSAAPRKQAHIATGDRLAGFNETNLGLGREEAREEAARCLRCGDCANCGACALFCPDIAVLDNGGPRPVFDFDFCKGCGICAKECPHAALVMLEEEK